MFLTDFHIHSNFSDGQLTIPELVDLYGEQGFGAIAITDHLCENETLLGQASRYLGCSLTKATFPIYQAILKSEAERAWDQYRMLVIPGFELTKNNVLNHRSAHILALGVTEWIDADGEAPEIAMKIKKQGGISVAAHPVWTRKIEKQTFYLWDHREEFQNLFDAWEVASGQHIFHEVENSRLPMLATSDLHKRSQLEGWKTSFNTVLTQEAILEAVKKQELDFHYFREAKVERAIRSVHFDMGYRPWTYGLGDLVRA